MASSRGWTRQDADASYRPRVNASRCQSRRGPKKPVTKEPTVDVEDDAHETALQVALLAPDATGTGHLDGTERGTGGGSGCGGGWHGTQREGSRAVARPDRDGR